MDSAERKSVADAAPDTEQVLEGAHPADAQTEPSDEQLSSGERLQKARQSRGLSIKDVSANTRLPADVLTALEAMETDHISPTFLRMHARAYAKFLELPEDEIASQFVEARATPNTSNMPAERLRKTEVRKRRQVWPVFAGVGLLLVIGFAVFWIVQPTAPKRSGVSSIASRVIQPNAILAERSTALATAKENELTIRAKRSAWIEVRGSDGTIFRSRNMSAGEIYYPRMNAAWTVTVRDAGAFEWWLDDHLIGSLGEPGMPAYAVNVDDVTARGIEQLTTALAQAGRNGAQPR